MPRFPEVISVTGAAVKGGVSAGIVRIGGKGILYPALWQDSLPVPHPVLEIELPEPGHVLGGTPDAAAPQTDTLIAFLPIDGAHAQLVKQAGLQIFMDSLSGELLKDGAGHMGSGGIVGEGGPGGMGGRGVQKAVYPPPLACIGGAAVDRAHGQQVLNGHPSGKGMERSVDLLWEEVRGLIGNAEQSLLYGNPHSGGGDAFADRIDAVSSGKGIGGIGTPGGDFAVAHQEKAVKADAPPGYSGHKVQDGLGGASGRLRRHRWNLIVLVMDCLHMFQVLS